MEKLVPLQNSGLQLSIDGMKPNKAGGGGGGGSCCWGEQLNIDVTEGYDEKSYAALNLAGRLALSNLEDGFDKLPDADLKQAVENQLGS
jgi:hypothetical protein